MMWRNLRREKAEDFQRYTGVSKEVFQEMIKVLKASTKSKDVRGCKAVLCVQDKLLIALEYWREYRTYFHIAKSRGISESTVSRIVRWVENSLIADERFHLPGKKALLEDAAYEVIVVDATETKVERP